MSKIEVDADDYRRLILELEELKALRGRINYEDRVVLECLNISGGRVIFETRDGLRAFDHTNAPENYRHLVRPIATWAPQLIVDSPSFPANHDVRHYDFVGLFGLRERVPLYRERDPKK